MKDAFAEALKVVNTYEAVVDFMRLADVEPENVGK